MPKTPQNVLQAEFLFHPRSVGLAEAPAPIRTADGNCSVRFTVDEDISFQVSSTYTPLINSEKANKNIALIQGLTSGIGGAGAQGLIDEATASATTSLTSYSVWSGTSPVTVALRGTFSSRHDGNWMKDIAYYLLALAVPKSRGANAGTGFTAPGVSPQAAFRAGSNRPIFRGADGRRNPTNVTVKIGSYFTLEGVIVSQATVLHSRYRDSNGLPLWGTIDLSFSSSAIATTRQLQQMLGYSEVDE